MRRRVWMSGMIMTMAVGLLALGVTGETFDPSAQTVWDWAIGLIALLGLIGIEVGIASRGFAQPIHDQPIHAQPIHELVDAYNEVSTR